MATIDCLSVAFPMCVSSKQNSVLVSRVMHIVLLAQVYIIYIYIPVMEYTASIVLEITSTSFYRNADPCFSSLLQFRIMYLLFVFMLAAVLIFLIQLTLIYKLSYKNFSETYNFTSTDEQQLHTYMCCLYIKLFLKMWETR